MLQHGRAVDALEHVPAQLGRVVAVERLHQIESDPPLASRPWRQHVVDDRHLLRRQTNGVRDVLLERAAEVGVRGRHWVGELETQPLRVFLSFYIFRISLKFQTRSSNENFVKKSNFA